LRLAVWATDQTALASLMRAVSMACASAKACASAEIARDILPGLVKKSLSDDLQSLRPERRAEAPASREIL
jgi:hypothetical protein